MNLQIPNHRNKVSVSREEYYGVNFRCHGDSVNSKSDIPVGLLGAAGENLEVFDLGFNSNFVQSFKEALFLARFGSDDISNGTNEFSSGQSIFDNFAEINLVTKKILGRVIKILRVDKNSNSLLFVFNCRHKKLLRTSLNN